MRFRYSPSVQQLEASVTALLEHADQAITQGVRHLLAVVSDRDHILEDHLAYLQVGDGPPTGKVTANVGTLYLNRRGGSGTTLYVKESGNDASGWVAK